MIINAGIFVILFGIITGTLLIKHGLSYAKTDQEECDCSLMFAGAIILVSFIATLIMFINDVTVDMRKIVQIQHSEQHINYDKIQVDYSKLADEMIKKGNK